MFEKTYILCGVLNGVLTGVLPQSEDRKGLTLQLMLTGVLTAVITKKNKTFVLDFQKLATL